MLRGNFIARQRGIARHLFLILCSTLVMTNFAKAAEPGSLPIKHPGEKGPIFSVATSQDKLADYLRDYYGQHHLVLSFFPAAFTPV